MPGLFVARGSSRLLKAFEDSIDLSRGNKILAIKDGPFIVGAQEFDRGSIQVVESQGKLLLAYSSTRISEDQLKDLLKSYLQGEKIFVHTLYQYLASDFSLVLYDKEKKKCLILTDPLGIRKMYYFITRETIMFSQSLFHIFRTLRNLDMYSTSYVLEAIDVKNIHLLLSQGYIDAPNTLFKKIKTTLPGRLYIVNIDGCLMFPTQVWNGIYLYTQIQNIIQKIHDLIIESIEYHIKGLRNVSILLSGGVDSSLILSLILRHFNYIQVDAFNTTYEGYSEVEGVNKIAEFLHFNMVHYLKFPTDPENILKYFIQSVKMLDEPHLKGTFLLRFYALTKIRERGLKVILAGDGGDEVFYGYWYNYWVFHRDYMRSLLSRLHRGILSYLCSKLPVASRVICDAYYLNKHDVQNLIKSHFSIDPRLLFYCLNNTEHIYLHMGHNNFIDMVSQYLYNTLTRTDLLTLENYAERMGLTIKFPYLYLPLVRYLSTLPPSYKIVNRITKFLLKALAIKYHYLPAEIVFSRKSGFSQRRLNTMLGNLILNEKEILAEFVDSHPVLRNFLNKLFKQVNHRNTHSVIQYTGLAIYLNSLINET